MHTKLSLFCEKLIEAGWLAAVVLVPVYFNIYSARTFEPDKITLMRSIALVMVLAWLIKVAEVGLGRAASVGDRSGQTNDLSARLAREESAPTSAIRQLWRRLTGIPLFLPTALVVCAYLISTACSISPLVALWGSYQRLQGTYSALSYIVIFALVASHLRSQAQLDRLMTTVIITSLPVGLYGIIQHYGRDPLPWAGDVQTRVASSLGNAIFVASYLIMAIPPTLARLLNAMTAILREERASWGNTLLGAIYLVILVVDVIAVVFSGSRGPWLGLLIGLFFFAFLALLLIYRQRSPEQVLSLKSWAVSLLETAGPVALGGLAGVLAYLLKGPWPVGGGELDLWGMLAIGLVLGALLDLLIIAARVTLGHGQWRLWMNWVIVALVLGAVLAVLNLPGSPLASVRSVPTVGRLGSLTEEGGTRKVRTLIWEGVLNLISPHSPLGIPDGPDEPWDNLNVIRPLFGYGPESMFNAFARVYPNELAHVEARGSSADRSHNETFDFLATMGIFGFVAYYLFIFSLFYYLLKAVGWVPDAAARRRLLILWGVGGVLGLIGPRLVTGNFVYSALGMPGGMVAMIFVYLFWQAVLDRPASIPRDTGQEAPVSTAQPIGQKLVLIGVFTALVAHFMEVHFVFSIAATYVYFWVFAGVVASWTYGAFASSGPAQPELTGESPPVDEVRRTLTPPLASKRRRRRPGAVVASTEAGRPGLTDTRPLPLEDWETWLGVFGLVVAIVLVAMVFDFVNAQFELARGNYAVVWMFAITWLLGLAVGMGEVAVRVGSWQTPIRWGRALLLYLVTSVGYTGFYVLFHSLLISGRRPPITDPNLAVQIEQARANAGVLTTLLLLFYVFVVLLLILIALMLAMPQFRRQQPTMRLMNWWLYPVLIAATVLGIWFKNFNVVYADMLLKQAEQYRNQGAYDIAIALHQDAIALDSDEDFYYLMLALAYQLKAQDGRYPAEVREQAWRQGVEIALEARRINPFNPDNTGNMGRYYLTWAQFTPSDQAAQQAERYQLALSYFEKATQLAPQNTIYYNLWAQTYSLMGEHQKAVEKLQQSVALDPLFDQTHMLLGDVYGVLGQPEAAIQAHRAAILLNPAAFADAAMNQRISFYREHGRVKGDPAIYLRQLIAAYQEAMPKFPKDALVPRTLGYLYSQVGDHAQAISAYQQAVALGDRDIQTWLGLGSEYLVIEDFERAAAAFQQAVQLDANHAQAHSNLGYALARLGRFDEAIQENRRVLEINPNDYISHRNLVLLYRDTNRLAEAIQQAQLMVQTTPDNELGPTYELVGNVYERAGQPANAAAAYHQAGETYVRQGRLEDALRIYQGLTQLTPDDYRVYRQLAEVFRQLKRWDEALAAVNLALAKAPPEQQADVQQLAMRIESEKGQAQQ